MGHTNPLLVLFLICGCAYLWRREGGKNSIALVRVMDTSAAITLRGVQVPALGECAWFAIIMGYMMVVVASAAQVRAKPRTRALRRY